MNMKYKISALALVAVMYGCKSSNSGEHFADNGTYYNSNSGAIVLIDIGRKSNQLVIADLNNSHAYIADNVDLHNDTLRANDFSYLDEDGYGPSKDMPITANVKSNKLFMVGKTQAISAEKIEKDVMETGSFLNEKGTEFTIAYDTSFVINGDCTVRGYLEEHLDHFDISDAQATGCSSAQSNGQYDGVAISIRKNNSNQLIFVLKNTNSILLESITTK